MFKFCYKLLQHRLNISKTIRKVPIDPHLRATAEEFHSTSDLHLINHGDEDHGDNSTYADIPLTGAAFEKFTHHFQILVVNFYGTMMIPEREQNKNLTFKGLEFFLPKKNLSF
jgi:hypothetical protein